MAVSAVGFGASPLGNVFGQVSPEQGDRVVQTAIDEGINFFDVSPYYGLTLAEQRLGEALGGRREEIVPGDQVRPVWSGPFRLFRRHDHAGV